MTSDQGLQRLSIENNLLIIEGRGAWRLSDITRSHTQLSKDLETLHSSTWGVLLLLKGDSIIIPEARERLIEIVKVDKTKGRKATALVLTDCSVPNLVAAHLNDLYSNAGDEFEEFTDIDSAKKWLNEKIRC